MTGATFWSVHRHGNVAPVTCAERERRPDEHNERGDAAGPEHAGTVGADGTAGNYSDVEPAMCSDRTSVRLGSPGVRFLIRHDGHARGSRLPGRR